jgi:hypothetical protein
MMLALTGMKPLGGAEEAFEAVNVDRPREE